MNYLLGGYYGMKNAGDDLLLYVTIEEVSRLDPSAQFTVIADCTLSLPATSNVKVVPGGRPLETLRQLASHDIWLFGGGGLLQDAGYRSRLYIKKLSRWVKVAKLLGRKVVLIGIGVGPLETPQGRSCARSILDDSDFVTVRSVESAQIAEALGVRPAPVVTSDLGFLISKYKLAASASPSGKQTKTLGISLLTPSGMLGKDQKDDMSAVTAIACALRRFLERDKDFSIKLFEFFSGSKEYGDATVLRVLEQELRGGDRVEYRAYDGDFLALYSDLSKCDRYLGMRYHACLLAWTAGVPCAMVAYHPKSYSLAKELRIAAEGVIPTDKLLDSAGLEARLEELCNQPSHFLPGLPIESVVRASSMNFALFADWLQKEGIRTPDSECDNLNQFTAAQWVCPEEER